MRLVSWNIRGAFGRDGIRDLPRIARVIRDLGADVAALQEVGDPQGRGMRALGPASTALVSRSADDASELGRLLGWNVAFGPNLVIEGRPYGNAVLSRLPIARAQNYDLSVPGKEPRGCLRCDLSMPDELSLHLFNLHLGLSIGERRRQEALLLSADLLHDAALTAPLVVCGDFNAWLPGPLPALLRRALRDVTRGAGATWPSALPFMRLDRAYVDGGVRVRAYGVDRSTTARLASDHLPVWLDLEPLPPQQAVPSLPPTLHTEGSRWRWT